MGSLWRTDMSSCASFPATCRAKLARSVSLFFRSSPCPPAVDLAGSSVKDHVMGCAGRLTGSPVNARSGPGDSHWDEPLAPLLEPLLVPCGAPPPYKSPDRRHRRPLLVHSPPAPHTTHLTCPLPSPATHSLPAVLRPRIFSPPIPIPAFSVRCYIGGRKRKLPAALTTEHNPPKMYAPTPFVPMPPDYDQSMELRKLMTSSAQGYKGDEEVSDVERTGAVHHGGLSTTGGAAAAVGYGVSSATGGAAGASGGGAAMEKGYGGGGKTGEAAAAGLYGGRGTAGGAAAAAAGGGSVAACGAAMEGAVGAASAGGFVGIGGIGMAAGGVSGGGGGYRGSGMAGEGAALRAYGGSGGAVAFPMSGGQHGSQYGLGAGYINGPAAVYIGGLAPPCAPPPSVPGSVQEQNGRAYVAPRFHGNNYSTVPSFGFDGHHASSMPNGGLYSSGFSTVSARLAPTVAAPPVPADVANLASSGCPVGLPTVAGAAGAVVGSQPGEAPIGSHAPSPSPYMQMHTQMPAPGPYSQAVAAMPRTLQPTMPTSPGVVVGTSGDLVDDIDKVTPVARGPFQGPCEPPPPPEHLAPVLRMASISAPPPPPPTPPPPPPAAAAAVASAATETRHVISKGRRSRRGGADTQSTKRKATTNFKAGGKKASTSTPSVIEGAGALLNMTPIDVDVQLSGQPEGRSIVIREGELKSVVQSAMAPLQAHIDMA